MRAIVAAAFLAAALVSQRADGDDTARARAEAHFQAGARQYRAKKYAEAIAQFRAAYALAPRSEILFAWAQAERLRGNCPVAVDLYQRFLTTGPTKRQADATRYHLDRCRALLRDPWYSDVLGGLLVGAGVVGLGVGAVFFGLSVADESAAASATSYSDYVASIDDARRERAIGFVAIGAGAALVVGGIIRYVVFDARGEPTSVGASVVPGGAWLGVKTSF